MKKIYKLLLSILATIILITINSTNVKAEVTHELSDFEIQPILPSNQVNMQLNYFDLTTHPNMKQQISVRVENFTNHDIVVKSDLRNAYTQMGGGINFKNSLDLDKSLKIPFTKIVTLDKGGETLNLGPKESTVITATINMPSNDYKGMIYGDWHFIEKTNKNSKNKTSITSNYSYSLGVSLRGKNYKIYPDIRYKNTSAILYNRHPAIGIKLRNINAMVLSKVSMKGVIKKKDSSEDQRSFITTGKTVAPNSELVLPISWAYDNLEPGTYEVTAKVHGYNSWNRLPMDFNFKKEIKIKKDDADKINRQALKRPKNKWIFIATAAGTLLLASVVETLRLFLKLGV